MKMAEMAKLETEKIDVTFDVEYLNWFDASNFTIIQSWVKHTILSIL